MRNSLVRKAGKSSIAALMGTLFLCAPGCLTFENQDRYTHLSTAGSLSGPYCPDIYPRENQKTVRLPLVRIECDTLPHDLHMYAFGDAYDRSYEGFEKYILDTIVVEFVNGETVTILSAETPLSERTFVIPGRTQCGVGKASHDFKGVITQRASFTVRISGTAVRDNGEAVPFQAKKVYRYNGRTRTFRTFLDDWTNC